MSAIRQLVRYGILGYILIVYASLMLLPFLDIESIFGNPTYFDLFGLMVVFFVSGIPLGWLVFQIYDDYFREYFGLRYAWKKPLELMNKGIMRADMASMSDHHGDTQRDSTVSHGKTR